VNVLKYALFTGCNIPQKANAYELSAKKVAEKLDIQLKDLEDTNCCGYFLSFIDNLSSTVLASRILSLAEEKGCDLVTLCNGCFGHLTRVNYALQTDESLLKKVNKILGDVGKKYEGKSKVKHFAQVLVQDVGIPKIKETIVKPLTQLRVAPHWGCHIVRPFKKIHFDDPEDTKILDSLINVIGAQLVDFLDRKMCCGGPVLGVEEKTALQILMEKMGNIQRANANVITTVCPFCHIQFDLNQLTIEEEYSAKYQIPVLHYPQLLGLAQGFSPDELGLFDNRVPVDDLLDILQI
jgi:heterodisulfide reductase subunit B